MTNLPKKVSVFLVEDYLLARVGLQHTLNNSDDIKIERMFETAEECLNELTRTQPDVILMDLGLPGINGIEATKIVKQKYPNIKVIILTSHEREQEALASLSSGAHAFCLKEIETQTLMNVIKTVNQGAIWLDPKIAQVAFSIVPQPNSTDFENLYSNEAENLNLTEREMAVLRLLVEGKTNVEIAKEIYISPHTAKAHVGSILGKFAVSDRVQAAVKAVRSKIVK